MYNDKKKASNARYLSKFKTITLRISEEEKQRIDEAAAQQQQSTASFILQAIRDKIEKASRI